MQKLQEKAQKLIEERNRISIRFNEINGAIAILNELAQEENTIKKKPTTKRTAN